MNRALVAVPLVLAAMSADPLQPGGCGEPKPADRTWIVGTWRGYELDSDFGEWRGAVQIELVASSPKEIGLFLISADGKRQRAGDSEPSIMYDDKLFFGPIGSGLPFRYERRGDDELVLDLRSAKVHAKLRRVKE